MPALLLNFLLSPVVRGLARLRIPEFVGAGLVLGGLLVGIAGLAYEFSGPVGNGSSALPRLLGNWALSFVT